MSTATELTCQGDAVRRKLSRATPLFGLDYLEVSDDQTQLNVYFLGKAPTDLVEANLVVRGGSRIQDLRVLEIRVEAGTDDLDDRLVVQLSGPGDFSSYELCVVELDGAKRATSRPRADFDPRYARLQFSFKTLCPSELDCRLEQACEPAVTPPQSIDYLAKDYGSFRQLMLDRLSLSMPGYTERHAADVGIALVEVLAYVADALSYEQDAVATEAYLDTARRRISVRRHLRLIDQVLHEGCNARAWVALTCSQDLTLDWGDVFFITTVAGVLAPVLEPHALPPASAAGYRVFEPLLPAAEATLRASRNEIRFHTWFGSECCLPVGATAATLLDPGGVDADGSPEYSLNLAVGDVLIFEEVKGPKTGNPADADPTRRHVVRLTRVEPTIDPLFPSSSEGLGTDPEPGGEVDPTDEGGPSDEGGSSDEGGPSDEGDGGSGGAATVPGTPIWNIEWALEDALPFALCLSSVGQACQVVGDVSVARGNVVLVDHGRSVDADLEEAVGLPTPRACPEPCGVEPIVTQPTRFRPWLPFSELTFSQGIADISAASAGRLAQQDPAQALPVIRLESWLPDSAGEGTAARDWSPRLDLLGSSPNDRCFVAEVDDERRVQLRFGRGNGGLVPLAGERFMAKYRVGSGVEGNVGAEAIAHIVFRNGLPNGVTLNARNPLPARGGTAPEAVASAKLRAPERLRSRRERAVIAVDYAEIVERDFGAQVQRAAALWRWNGHGAEIVVAIDAHGRAEAPPELVAAIQGHLQGFRRIGHDVRVASALQVPLLLELTVCLKPGYQRGAVERTLLQALGSRRYGDGKLGLFHPDRLSFGAGVYASPIVQAVQAVTGVESVQLTALERLFEGPNGELERGVLELGPLEIARLDSDPSFPEHGRIRLNMEGGR